MKRCSLLVLCFCLLSTSAMGTNNNVPLKKGMSYQKAVSELRHSGWAARKIHMKNEYTYEGTENTMRSHGVKGIENCAMDKPICILNYVKGTMCLRVFTWGEEFKDLRVDSWNFDCPPKESM